LNNISQFKASEKSNLLNRAEHRTAISAGLQAIFGDGLRACIVAAIIGQQRGAEEGLFFI
jgi:hypothetical protein